MKLVNNYECDVCHKTYNDYNCSNVASIPPSGIFTDNAFICSECIRQYFISTNDLLNAVILYKESSDTFDDDIKFIARYFLPNIFNSRRQQIPSELKSRILKKFNYQCVRCGSKENLSIDHIKPYAKGGPTIYNNLQVLCKSCNSRKGAKYEG